MLYLLEWAGATAKGIRADMEEYGMRGSSPANPLASLSLIGDDEAGLMLAELLSSVATNGIGAGMSDELGRLSTATRSHVTHALNEQLRRVLRDEPLVEMSGVALLELMRASVLTEALVWPNDDADDSTGRARGAQTGNPR